MVIGFDGVHRRVVGRSVAFAPHPHALLRKRQRVRVAGGNLCRRQKHRPSRQARRRATDGVLTLFRIRAALLSEKPLGYYIYMMPSAASETFRRSRNISPMRKHRYHSPQGEYHFFAKQKNITAAAGGHGAASETFRRCRKISHRRKAVYHSPQANITFLRGKNISLRLRRPAANVAAHTVLFSSPVPTKPICVKSSGLCRMIQSIYEPICFAVNRYPAAFRWPPM